MVEYFVVQPFERGSRGFVYPVAPIEARGAEHAIRLADRLSCQCAGAIAFSRKGDPATGEYEDAVVLAVFGAVPEGAQELAMAS